jgi:Tuberculosis necrotizing toxin
VVVVRVRLILATLGVVLLGPGVAPALAVPPANPSSYECSGAPYQGDPELGPDTFPALGPVAAELRGYARTGGAPATQFLAMYFDPAAGNGAGSWRYPPEDGYVLDGVNQPIKAAITLPVRTGIDRYGSEFGAFLAPTGSNYAARSIPPSNLNGQPAGGCNYHSYVVVHAFPVEAGPVAAWFGQPGGGVQYQLDRTLLPAAPVMFNVRWLVDNGYLDRVR